MLHYVSDEEAMKALEPWNITKASFIRLLDFIEKKGLKTVGFEDATANDPQQSIVITFDDCAKQLWDFAIPELVRRKMKAVFFMPTAHIGDFAVWNSELTASQLSLMNETDLQQLVEAGMEVGSHSHHHILLEEETVEKAVEEIATSAIVLKSILGKRPVVVAYPFGSIPQNYYQVMEDSGFQYGLGVNTYLEDRYLLSRWTYANTMDENDIETTLAQEYKRKRKLNNPFYTVGVVIYHFAYRMYAASLRKLLRRD